MIRSISEYCICLLVLVVFATTNGTTPAQFDVERQRILAIERSGRLGAGIKLTAGEKEISDLLLNYKRKEIESARVNGSIFPPARSFFITKPQIDQSQIFKIIQKMPKGGALHTHDSSITSLEWLVKNATYRANCYMCYTRDNQLRMKFFKTPPTDNDCSWKTVASERSKAADANKFDQDIISKISIIVDNPDDVYITVDDVWRRFSEYFQVLNGLYLYEPVFRDYFYEALKQFLADNVQYIEIRALLSSLYTLDGQEKDAEYTLNIYRNVTKQFKQQNPTFIGCKIIQSGIRSFDAKSILTTLKQAISFRQKYPDIFRGFDLVGQEGPGNPLHYYLDDLLYPSQQQPHVDINYFFHAGETDWEGTQVDLNLVDAVLLNTSRIGHGFALYKHPEVLRLIKVKDIAIEVNPISNQVLKLVADLRNHGAVTLFAENYPVVVSSDDPAAWGALPLSHDFYMAYMAMTSEDSGLEVLKQLAINSIKYSAMTISEQQSAMSQWKLEWDKFVTAMSPPTNTAHSTPTAG